MPGKSEREGTRQYRRREREISVGGSINTKTIQGASTTGLKCSALLYASLKEHLQLCFLSGGGCSRRKRRLKRGLGGVNVV